MTGGPSAHSSAVGELSDERWSSFPPQNPGRVLEAVRPLLAAALAPAE